jgi:hypothetical protein
MLKAIIDFNFIWIFFKNNILLLDVITKNPLLNFKIEIHYWKYTTIKNYI